MDLQTQALAPASASFIPTPADLDEFATIRAIHDVLDLAPDLPLSIRLGLLGYAAAVLEGDRQAASEPRLAREPRP